LFSFSLIELGVFFLLCLSNYCFTGDSPTSVSTSISAQHRRQISGYVNNHRPVPAITSATPPRRSSTSEQQLTPAAQRLSLTKITAMINNDNTDVQSPTKM
jgi:hypothetical protein